jgi:hypothetical protein
MEEYLKLMMESDNHARQQFFFDPRVMMNNSRYASSNIEAFNGTKVSAEEVVEGQYVDIEQGSRNDAAIVQDTPQTTSVKRYVIVDSSQRDWLRQPNPFSNLVYTFGSQSTVSSNPPVYTNNPFVPTFSVEQLALPSPIPGIPNIQGWTLPATPSNISYPPYNSSLPRGNFIAYDTGYTIQPSGPGFGSVFTPCNVQSIRLVRAVLPQKQFLNIPIVPGSTDSSAIQTNLVGKPYSTFTTYPYLLLYLNEYYGQYVGGNEPMRRSFSVMTQKQRQQVRFDIDEGNQQFDYEPWGEEALRLQSPITNFQRIAITVTDPIGITFPQNDNLALSLIQATTDRMFLKCFTGSFNYFSSNDMRVGDRIIFYPQTISNLLKSTILAAQNEQKRAFLTNLLNNTFPVLELLDYVQDADGLYVPRDASNNRTQPYIASYNGFLIPNFITADANGNAIPVYPNAVDSGTFNVIEPNLLIGSNIPILNTTLQPVYTFELEVLQPNTSQIGGTIVL